MNVYEARKVLNELTRKLFLLKGEEEHSKRNELIDSMLNDVNGEISRLNLFLKEVKEGDASS